MTPFFALAAYFRQSSRSGVGQALLIIFAFLLVSLVAFIWAAFLRRPGRKHHHHHHHSRHRRQENPPHPKPASGSAPEEGDRSATLRRRRLRRREHRPRNPTLSEAGGLPPVRPDDVSPPGL